MATPAGQLDQRITLQQRSSTPDALGQVVASWVDVAVVWASVVSVRSRDAVAAGQQQASSTVRVTIRARGDVTARTRIVWRGQACDIVGDPLPDGRGWLKFDAVSNQADAREPAAS